jgi:hypothetical protein
MPPKYTPNLEVDFIVLKRMLKMPITSDYIIMVIHGLALKMVCLLDSRYGNDALIN